MADDMDMSQNSAQLAMWKLLGDTQAVVSATGDCFVRPGKAVDEAQRKGRGFAATGKSAHSREGTAGSETPWAKQGMAKTKLTIGKARYGNRAVIQRRD